MSNGYGVGPYGLFLLDCSDQSYTQHALIPYWKATDRKPCFLLHGWAFSIAKL